MPSTMTIPSQLIIHLEPLTAEAFAPFGTVISTPIVNPSTTNPQSQGDLPPNATLANQGTAIKISDISPLDTHYSSAPSKSPARSIMTMFICSPRPLRSNSPSTTPPPRRISYQDCLSNSGGTLADAESKPRYFFDVEILERHPFTTQTFVPLGLSPDNQETCYLVIVAPTVADASPTPTSGASWSEEFRLSSGTAGDDTQGPPISPPNLPETRAFLAHGGQAVTYAAGTWHAPMVVLGARAVEFVVVQFANGVADEDCQEVEIAGTGAEGRGASVEICLNRLKDVETAKAKI